MTTTLPLIRIVDDDEELRNSQKMLLASLGWSVKTYESALAFLSDDELTRPGCLILDVRMPGMTGLELQQELMRREIKLFRSSFFLLMATLRWQPIRCGMEPSTFLKNQFSRRSYSNE